MSETAVIDPVEVEETQQYEKRARPEVKLIPMGLIERSEVALRDVDRETEEFQNLCESIRTRGVLNSILVREIQLPGGVVKYGLIDGLQRFSASMDIGLDEIPARIVSMEDSDVLEAQIITNMSRIQTKPAELSKHLLRILARNPLMTKDELARRVCQSRTWIDQRLSLSKLDPKIQELVDQGRIHLTNAYALAKLPREEQSDNVDAAISEAPATFVARMKDRAKEIRDAKHSGKDPKKNEFTAIQHLQKVSEVKSEYSALFEGKGDSKIVGLLKKNSITDPLEAVKMAISWMLHFDPESIEAQKEKDRIRKERAKDVAERRKKEREEQKAEEAAQEKADLTSGW